MSAGAAVPAAAGGMDALPAAAHASATIAAPTTTAPSTNIAARENWQLPETSPAADALAKSARLPPVIAALLHARGVCSAEEAALFLAPRLEAMHDPYRMLGMAAAVERVQRAIADRETILIYGDYDVDGTIAVVLLKTAIEMLGGTCRFHVPHRLRDGYGMQAGPLAQACADGVRLVVSVDNGIRAFAAAEQAALLGLDLIVTDHHLPDRAQGVPLALAVLNPNQAGCEYPCKHLCGAGVAFKLAQALLEANDRDKARTKVLPSFLKLLALATVADAVPLLGENRIFVALGIEQLANPVHPGLRALMELADVGRNGQSMTARDIAFRLAPRLNAAGRMDVASDVVDLFTTRDADHARALAEKLHGLNETRRNTEQTALKEIERRLAADAALADARCLVLDGHGWHRGVIGILASRVVERTGKPTLVLAHEDGEAYGSGRSVEDFHLLDAITSCAELFTRFGGHAHAVGFSLPSERVPELRRRLETYARAMPDFPATARATRSDAELPLDTLTPEMLDWLRRFAPYGMDNEEPVLLARRVRVAEAPRIMKELHVRLRVAQGVRGAIFPAVGWKLAARVQSLGIEANTLIDLAYKVRGEQGRFSSGTELEIVDLRPAECG